MSNILDRIRQLLAIANDSGASQNEAEMAYMQAQKLMRKHAIEEWMLHKDEQEIAWKDGDTSYKQRALMELSIQLLNIIARANNCRCAIRSEYGRRTVNGWRLYGVESDVSKAELLWTSMCMYITKHATDDWQRTQAFAMFSNKHEQLNRNDYLASWHQGFNKRIKERFAVLEADATSDCKAMVVSKTALLDKYESTLHMGTYHMRNHVGRGTADGYASADNVAIGLSEMQTRGWQVEA